MTVSICGAVDLLAAIFGEDKEKLRLRYGLPTKRKLYRCLNCGKPTPHREFCNQFCKHEYSFISLECPQCGRIFSYRGSEVIYRLNHVQTGNGKVQERIFCSIRCRVKFYGFRAHPENAGRRRKWDWEQVWKSHQSTGMGSLRLSRLLGIPESTFYAILRKKKKNWDVKRRRGEK